MCVCAADITVQAGKLVDFRDVRCPVMGCIERYSAGKLVHYHLVVLEISNHYLFMTLIGNPCISWASLAA